MLMTKTQAKHLKNPPKIPQQIPSINANDIYTTMTTGASAASILCNICKLKIGIKYKGRHDRSKKHQNKLKKYNITTSIPFKPQIPEIEQPAMEQPAMEQSAMEQPAMEQPAMEQKHDNVTSDVPLDAPSDLL